MEVEHGDSNDDDGFGSTKRLVNGKPPLEPHHHYQNDHGNQPGNLSPVSVRSNKSKGKLSNYFSGLKVPDCFCLSCKKKTHNKPKFKSYFAYADPISVPNKKLSKEKDKASPVATASATDSSSIQANGNKISSLKSRSTFFTSASSIEEGSEDLDSKNNITNGVSDRENSPVQQAQLELEINCGQCTEIDDENMGKSKTSLDSSNLLSSAPNGESGNGTKQFYTLTVRLKNGKNLVIKDKSGSSDPYVKIKRGDKTFYKSKVIPANLNPVWDETFTIPIDDIAEPLVFKVADYDWGSKDDFMGMCSIDLRRLSCDKPEEIILPLTKKGIVGDTVPTMGELFATLTLNPRTSEEKDIWFSESASSQAQMKLHKQTWNGILTVLLIDAFDLPKRTNDGGTEGYSNVFAKIMLGSDKRKTKHINETTTRPEWLEQFDFYLYESSGSRMLDIQLFEDSSVGRIPLGTCAIDISLLPKEHTEDVILNLSNGFGKINLFLTITGLRPSALEAFTDADKEKIKHKYALSQTLKLDSLMDVGHLTVKVHEAHGLRAADMNGKSDPYCILELGNQRVQTHTDYKTLEPKWNKTFHFEVRDITSKLEVIVYDEDADHKSDFLGKIVIPLWKIQSGEKIWYRLKNRKLAKGARGNNPQVLLEMDLIWNPIRAAIRITDPQEEKRVQYKAQLKIETFLINIERIRRIIMGVYEVLVYIKTCLDWKYPDRSLKALIFYELFCYFFQPFFIPLLLLFFWIRPWIKIRLGQLTDPDVIKRSYSKTDQNLTIATVTEDTLALEEDVDDEDEEIRNLTLLEKFSVLQDASGVLQELLGEVASTAESAINSYKMVIPFVYNMIAIILVVATIALMIIPVRYVAMILGLHEFSRVFLRPWKKSSFEPYHLIRRVPDNQKLAERIGIHSVLKTIQQIKNKRPSNKLGRFRTKTSPPTSPNA